jgi:hypothetical protein
VRILLFLLALAPLALAQGVVKGVTEAEVAALLKEAGIPYERTEPGRFRLEMAGLDKVWLSLEYCQGSSCGVLLLAAGFTLEEPPALEDLNLWNGEALLSRAYLDEESAAWVESDLDLTGGVSREAVKVFLQTFAQDTLPDFMEFIGFKP